MLAHMAFAAFCSVAIVFATMATTGQNTAALVVAVVVFVVMVPPVVFIGLFTWPLRRINRSAYLLSTAGLGAAAFVGYFSLIGRSWLLDDGVGAPVWAKVLFLAGIGLVAGVVGALATLRRLPSPTKVADVFD